jgi:g-D-glutamyl-meso-diaminopimelate peptidase
MQVTVRSGDTFWYYSQLFQVPLGLIAASNPAVNPALLQPGQAVQIPGYVTDAYSIQAGDTLWKLAASMGRPVDALLLVNPGIRPEALTVGQTVRIPRRINQWVVNVNRPYNYAALTEDLRRLTELYPFLRQRSIGNSVMNKPIPEIVVGVGNRRVHANGSFHANEWITTPVLVGFLNEYALSLTNGRSIGGQNPNTLYQAVTLSVVPMVNPDGVDLVVNGPPAAEPYRSEVLRINGGSTDFSGWKANIRGVDLNDQFPAFWEREAERGQQQPAPRDYPGTAPLTEPEANAIARLTGESNFNRVLAYHTQGEVIYWGFMGFEPPESARLVNLMSEVSGYEPIRYVESYAGYKDWFIQYWRRPGFTVELGLGVNPLPLDQFGSIYQAGANILLAAMYG